MAAESSVSTLKTNNPQLFGLNLVDAPLLRCRAVRQHRPAKLRRYRVFPPREAKLFTRAFSRLARKRRVRVSASSSHSSFSRKVRLRSSNRSNSRLPSGVPQRQSGSMSNGCFIERVAILQCPSNPAGGRRHASFSEAFSASPLAPKRRGKLQAGQPAKIQRQNQTVHK